MSAIEGIPRIQDKLEGQQQYRNNTNKEAQADLDKIKKSNTI